MGDRKSGDVSAGAMTGQEKIKGKSQGPVSRQASPDYREYYYDCQALLRPETADR